MIMKSRFNIGDKVFCILGGNEVHDLTIGQVRIVITDSLGTGDTLFDNYKPQRSYKEEYMCVESGIGCGSVYTLDRNIFATEEEANDALDKFFG